MRTALQAGLSQLFGRADLRALALIALVALAAGLASMAGAQSVRPPAGAVQNAVPGEDSAVGPGAAPGLQGRPEDALARQGNASDSDLWRAIREGDAFTTQKRGAVSGVLVQSEGSAWREMRDGPLATLGLYVLGGVLALLLVFFLLRGRIRIEHGRADVTITRFTAVERFGHWLLAGSFVVLAISGLLMLYGKTAVMPLIGKEAFAALLGWNKIAHNYLAFAFIAGLVVIFATWVAHNIPNRHDLVWLSKAGGLFSKHVHPPSRKFNAGQKLIFWSTILLGGSLAVSGWALLFPFQYEFFAGTFAALNTLGLDLPTTLTPMQEMQLVQLWHGFVALLMMAVILAHIYIGSIGMEGAFDAMGNGDVDLNWAKEHHNLWVEEELVRENRARLGRGAATPAE
jgi:formate dehydrogenase subunit gamma